MYLKVKVNARFVKEFFEFGKEIGDGFPPNGASSVPTMNRNTIKWRAKS